MMPGSLVIMLFSPTSSGESSLPDQFVPFFFYVEVITQVLVSLFKLTAALL